MKYISLIIASFLCACSGGSSINQMEFDDCARVPRDIKVVYESGTLKRYQDYGYGMFDTGFHNPEHATTNGPGTGRNCTVHPTRGVVYEVNDNDIQHVSYRLKTQNYYSNLRIVDHIATITRGRMDRTFGVNGGTQIGIGIALFSGIALPDYRGLYAERFSTGTIWRQTDFVPVDNRWYTFDIESRSYGLIVSVHDDFGGYWEFTWLAPEKYNEAGWGIGIVMNQMTDLTGFQVDIQNLEVRWEWAS